MEITQEMQKAIDVVCNTSDNIFITGKAGTGKTTLLRHIIQKSTKTILIAAPTGVAAINAGGVTLHSLFNLPFEIVVDTQHVKLDMPPMKIGVLQNADTIIIDEISMVRPDMLDVIDKKLQLINHNTMPFGGTQIVMFGDLHQLPPVIKSNEKLILKQYYNDLYFFGAHVFAKKGFHVVNLSKVFRQSDQDFIHVLNGMRTGELSALDLDILKELRSKGCDKSFDGKTIHLCTHRRDAAKINDTMMGKTTNTYKASLTGKFKDSNLPCESELKLRIGARVMILVNDNIGQLYCNGTLGEITALDDRMVTVMTDEGYDVDFGVHEWDDFTYTLGENNKIEKVKNGACSQIPVVPAWAITIHKSQGLTFDNVIVHVDKSFCAGQTYVALSRCRTLQGIQTDSFITQRNIIVNKEAVAFEEKCKIGFYGNNLV